MSEFMGNEEGRAEGIGAPAEAQEKTVEFDFDKAEDAALVVYETPSKHDTEALIAHTAAGHELIPVDGKRPAKSGWRRMPALTPSDAMARFSSGRNVGVRLRDIDLVIDIDPRNFVGGLDSFDDLRIDFGLPDAPFVRTGGGGFHYYFRKPADLVVVNELDAYPGVEFKSLGRQVVAAGSVHPNGKPYGLDDDVLALSLRDAPEATTALLNSIRRPFHDRSATRSGEITPEQLERLLSKRDIALYNSRHDEWLKIMMSAHHGTDGAGVDEFVAWSLGDHDYAGDEDVIRGKWNSLTIKPGGVTIATLFKVLSDAGYGAFIEEVRRSPAVNDFPDDISVEVEPAKARVSSVWNDWVWVVEPYQFVRRSDTRKFRTEQWKSVHANLKPEGDVLNAIWKNSLRMRKFETLVYLPEGDEFPDGEEGGRYNIWRKSGIEAKAGDVSIFLDHMEYLFPDEGDRNHVIDYLALLVQRPADKIHFALMVRGMQGTGKSWIGNLMERIVGRRNTVRPSNDEVTSRWTAWMEGAQLAIIEELMTLGRRDVANRLKPAITDPTLRIEEKNCAIYSIPNCLNFLCFTNHEDALPIEHGDRRWLVVFSPAVKRDEAYYQRLFAYLDDGGAAFVKHWLAERKVGLKPHGVAPATTGKEAMRRLGMGDAEAYVLDLFESGQQPFDFDLVRLDDLVDIVPGMLRGRSNLRARMSKLLKEEIGAIDQSRYTKGGRNRPAYQLWSVREHDAWREAGAAARIDAFMAFRLPFEMERGKKR